MDSVDIFSLALGLESPWIVKEVKMQDVEESGKKTLHIYIDFSKSSEFKIGEGSLCKVYDTEERTWQHLNFFEHACYLHARVPRVVLSDGKVRTINVPWARKGSGFTLIFEAYTMLLIESEMPISKIAKCLNTTSPPLWRVFDYWIELAVSEDDLSSVCEIGIDETSSKKGHKYVSLMVDMASHRVIDVKEGKGKEVVEEFVHTLEAKGGDKSQIEQVSLDMSAAFIAGTMEVLPNAQQTFDKFHSIQHANIKAHWYGIVNYFDSKMTNGLLEGINSKIQLIKRRARGYRKIKNFINMIHFCCGRLKLDYPQYSL